MSIEQQTEASGRVLLVDDDPAVRRDYGRFLRRLGCRVEDAEDGDDALDKLNGAAFDLIISDIGMPRMTGMEFLRAVRQRDLDVPVILITGAPDVRSAVQAVEYGAFHYLPKPVSLDVFERSVQKALRMHELARLKRRALDLLGSEGKQLGDRASLDARFSSALDHLWMAYQPIVDVKRRSVFAYEALLRSKEPSLMTPPDLLDAAERLGRVHDLGRCIRRQVAGSAPEAPAEALLFVNLHAADLNDPELLSPTAPLSAIAPRVVLEITERASLHAVTEVTHKIDRLRSLGYRVAVDDLGAGYAGLSSFAQLEPEFVKLDMSLVRDIDASPRKRSLVRAMARLCNQDLRIDVISEGVETTGERDTLVHEGCRLLQGYLFAKPAREFTTPPV